MVIKTPVIVFYSFLYQENKFLYGLWLELILKDILFGNYNFVFSKLQMISRLEITAEDQLRRTRLFSLAQQLRSLEERIRNADVQIRQVSRNISKKLLSIKQFFVKKGQEDPELKQDSQFKLLVNWLDNFSSSYKISGNPQGQINKIILEILIKAAGDIEGFGYIQIIQMQSELNQLAEIFASSFDKKSLQSNTRRALDLRFRLTQNYLKCSQSLKALKEVEKQINTSSSLFEQKSTKVLRQILKDILWDDHISQIINKIRQVTEQDVEQSLIKIDLNSVYVDFEVQSPKLVKIIVQDPKRVKAREVLVNQLTQQIAQTKKQTRVLSQQSNLKIEYEGEKFEVKDSIFGLWEQYQKQAQTV